ncbi:MAG: hypothetical protein IJV07_00410, partial [Alphaproteobacteria bacterium]|nr:hypothetical protein [Alphaproteobacteria bacterium]
GCMSVKPVVRERTEIKTDAFGHTVTNVTQSVEYQQEYTFLGKMKNATVGAVKGTWTGMVNGYEAGTNTNGLENATFWDKSMHFTTNFFGSAGKGAAQGAEAGFDRNYTDDKAKQEAVILENYRRARATQQSSL